MVFRLCAAAATVVVMSLSAGGAWAQPARSAADYERLFDATWNAVDNGFYDPTFHGVDWKATGARYRARLGEVRDDAGFEKLAGAMLAELKVSHLFISPPAASSAATVGIGVALREDGGAQLVEDVAPLSDAWRKGVRPGQLLLSPRAAVAGDLGSEAAVTLKACDSRLLRLKVRHERAYWPPARPAFFWSRITPRQDFSVGYLRVDRFDDGAAALIDQAMADLKDTSALIIDVRGNTGGNTSALRLASYFTGPAAPAVGLFARPYLKALGRPLTAADIAKAPTVSGVYTDAGVFKAVSNNGGQAMFYTEDMGARRYAGPVAVLIGADTGSAAEGFVWQMKLKTKARLIGRRTVGALLSSDKADLGQGWILTLPVQGLWGPDGKDFADQAIAPDDALPRGRADLCSGRDRDLERAMDVIGARP